MQLTRKPTRALAALVALSLVLQVFLASVPVSIASAAPATKPTFPQPYPWSRTAASTTGDYIADSYDGVSAGHVFENVTTDRLLDILSSNGNYYILFAGPEHATGQAALAAINEQAKADGITKIYHFDPYLDGFQLDITDTRAGGVGTWTGGSSINYDGTATVNEVWRLITDLLPNSAVAPGGALYGYKGTETLLFSVSITDRQDVQNGKVINGVYRLKSAGVPGFNATSARTAVSALFHKGPAGALIPSSQRSHYEFFKRLYNASASNFNTSSWVTTPTATSDRTGAPVEIFKDSDYPGGAGFALKAIDIKELYNLLNSPGEHAILFAGQGCHNTQAIIGSVAKRAKELGLGTVYVADFALNSNVKYGTGAEIDKAVKIGATNGLWIRNSASATIHKFSYLYGEFAKYLGENWVTENSSKKNNSIDYYPNGDTDGTLTTVPYSGGNDNPNLGTKVPSAKRLQVPTVVAYNKDAVDPVTQTWLHLDSTSTEADKRYTEYMLELAWVLETPEALADTRVRADGLTRVEFAREAVAALDPVLSKVKNYVPAYSAAPQPEIAGTLKVGQTLTANAGTWFPVPSFAYQWYANNVAIAGATGISYQLTAAELGKKISVKATGEKPGFPTLARTSKQTVAVTGVFTKTSQPTISGIAKVGQTLKVNAGSWSPVPTFSYQWYANGAAIAGATSSSYKITSASAGKKITVKVTGTSAGLPTTASTSKSTATVKGVFTKAPQPTVSGTARVGKTLKVKAGTWSPKPKFSYQWYANGKKISKATKSSLKLTKTLQGKKITVKVTAKQTNYDTLTKASKATVKVKKK